MPSRSNSADSTNEHSSAKSCSVSPGNPTMKLESASSVPRLEDLERRLSVLEEKLLAALTMTTPEAELVALRTEADREIAPYRSKMPAAQIVQLQKQFIHKRMLEKATMPRLSLFYM